MSGYIIAGNTGTVFRYTIKDQDGDVVDVSSASTKQLKFTSPHGAVTTLSADFYTDGTDGIVECRNFTPDIAGRWRVRGYLTGVSGFGGHSTVDQFTVLATDS